MTFTIFDIVVLTIITLSSILGFYRGFIYIIINLIGLVAAVLVAIFLYPHTQTIFALYVSNKLILYIASGMVAFLLSLLIFSFLSGKIVALVKENTNGMVDKVLGLALGFVRGFLFCMVIFFFAVVFTTEEKITLDDAESIKDVLAESKYAGWIKASKSTPYLEAATKKVVDILPESIIRAIKIQPEEESEEKSLEKKDDVKSSIEIPLEKNSQDEAGSPEKEATN